MRHPRFRSTCRTSVHSEGRVVCLLIIKVIPNFKSHHSSSSKSYSFPPTGLTTHWCTQTPSWHSSLQPSSMCHDMYHHMDLRYMYHDMDLRWERLQPTSHWESQGDATYHHHRRHHNHHCIVLPTKNDMNEHWTATTTTHLPGLHHSIDLNSDSHHCQLPETSVNSKWFT